MSTPKPFPYKLEQLPDLQPARKHARHFGTVGRVIVAVAFAVVAALSVFLFAQDRFFIVSSFQAAAVALSSLPFLGALFHLLSRTSVAPVAAVRDGCSKGQLDVAKAMVDAVNRADATGQQHHEIDVLSAISHQLQHAGSAVILTKDMGVVHKHLRSRFAITTRGFGYTPMYTRLSLALRDAAPTPVLRA